MALERAFLSRAHTPTMIRRPLPRVHPVGGFFSGVALHAGTASRQSTRVAVGISFPRVAYRTFQESRT